MPKPTPVLQCEGIIHRSNPCERPCRCGGITVPDPTGGGARSAKYREPHLPIFEKPARSGGVRRKPTL